MDESIGVLLFLKYLRPLTPVWFKNPSVSKKLKIHHVFGKNHDGFYLES
jgi:hypothetical protein